MGEHGLFATSLADDFGKLHREIADLRAKLEQALELRLHAERMQTQAEARARRLEEALKLLVADVQDYEPWQRPCRALDVARAALNPPSP